MNTNLIENTILENIQNQAAVFVFPTQTAADLWADKIIKISTVKAVAMERFLAWDTFKGSSIKSQQKNKTSIPSTLRLIFTDQILWENKKSPFFKSIIPPEYADTASGFINWISGLLPSLSVWKSYFEKSNKAPDKEDEDYLKLYELYSDFLEKNNMFDPAWEKPPFNKDGNHYFIFFPEILSDYSEYKTLLEASSSDITLIHLPEEKLYNPEVQFYSNSRTELRSVALQLRMLHEEKNIPWDEIAISVPDMDNYGPYLDRELDLYEIPHVMRYAKPLTSSGGGSFFVQIQECVNSNFTFESIKNLLLNSELPWKEPDLSSQLIEFGQDNNCICSFKYNDNIIDVWKKSFSDNPNRNILVENYYRNLNEQLKAIVNAESFDEIRSAYFAFRSKFFDMTKCAENTDKLISRCISELGALIDLERDFPECKVSSPYSFFITQLEGTNYLAQTKDCGVQLLPYKTGAAAPFKCHVIIDASQTGISVIYKKLSFLREDKRQLLLGTDDANVTEHFIQLYAMNSENEPIFTAASKTFTGYAQSSSYLIEKICINNSKKGYKEPDFLNDDFYLKEKAFFLDKEKNLAEITATSKQGFEFWKECQINDFSNPDTVKENVNAAVKSKRFKDGKLSVSNTNLRNFFFCHRYWLIHSVIKLEPQINEAELMDPFAMGNLNHRILEFFCNSLKEKKLPLTVTENGLSEDYLEILEKCIDDAINEKDKYSYLARQLLLTTKNALTAQLKQTVTAFCEKFLDYTVYGTEIYLSCEIPEIETICDGYIDCLLQNPSDGGFALVDFKSSASGIPKNLYVQEEIPKGENETLPDFQMPLYLYLLENQATPIQAEECYFYNLKDCKFTEVELDSFQPTKDKLLDCIHTFEQFVRNQDYYSNPTQDYSTCNSCDYRAVCRKVFNVAKKD